MYKLINKRIKISTFQRISKEKKKTAIEIENYNVDDCKRFS